MKRSPGPSASGSTTLRAQAKVGEHKPSTAEFLDAFRACRARKITPDPTDPRWTLIETITLAKPVRRVARMKTTPAGFADVVEAAEALQLRGPALEAMAAMFGFALPSSSDAVPLRPPSQPPPDETDDDAGDAGVIAAAAEALSPSVRRLEPVRQGPAPAARGPTRCWRHANREVSRLSGNV